ncbi:hypothetical protein BIY22_03735 [Vibrio panuliri]|uniref:Uncharacterized protein n=1 Tax=Vibrio panuliri TaxID=1381081 RepID=A0A1Q9HIJ6_9VIBR|nr:hypothetical protein [Vibrio panuliri]OLQ90126.1 hypothetical protein BIY22_03735 [Vibrio panuliri]
MVDSGYALQSLILELDGNDETKLALFLDKIECPESFRGLFHVVSYLEQLSNSYPKMFERTFGIKGDILKNFSALNEEYWATYSLERVAKGWMSHRPIYALILKLAEFNNHLYGQAGLIFLDHFFCNEVTIKNESREESAVRAFRLFVTDRNSNQSTLIANQPVLIAEQLQQHRFELVRENPRNHTLEGYIRELEHFYRLDWKPRVSLRRSIGAKLRGAYSRKKIERIEGSTDLYTLALNKQKINKFNLENGLDSSEDIPPLTIVKQIPEVTTKPKHELPDVATIRDLDKDKQRRYAIQKGVNKSHNISPNATSLLQPHELFYLTESLAKYRTKSIMGMPTEYIQRVIFLTLFLGIDIDQIKELQILDSPDGEGYGFLFDDSKWYLKVHMVLTAKIAGHRNNASLLKVKPFTLIQLPLFFISYLKLDTLNAGDRIFKLKGEALVLKAVQQYLKSVNERYHIQISYKSIRYFLANKIASDAVIDPVIVECLSGKSNYYTRSMRHYIWRSDNENTRHVYELWNSIRVDIEKFKPSNLIPAFNIFTQKISPFTLGVGSQFTPTMKSIQLLVGYLSDKLQSVSAFESTKNIEMLIQYHNNFTLYTAYMLLNATGYRAVHNPLPVMSLFLLRYNALCISDKDAQKCFAHSRIVAVPDVLKKQLVNYLGHLNSMGNLLGGLKVADSKSMFWHSSLSPLLPLDSKGSKLDWFFSAKHSRSNDGLLTFYDLKMGSSKNISPKTLSEAVPKELRLPINYGRHYVRRFLVQSGVSLELVNFQLGHWVNGELPLSNFSTFKHSAAINELNEHLDSMMIELGWKDIPSNLTRKRT